MSVPDPGAGYGRIMLEKLKLILVILGRDLGQTHRHGLGRLLASSILLIIVFTIVFGFAFSLFAEIGVPPWTKDVLYGDGPGGIEPLSVDIGQDVYIGHAPLTVNFTAIVENAQDGLKYEWYVDFQGEGDEVRSRDATFLWTFHDLHSHSVSLVVEDERESPSDPIQAWVQVVDPGDPNVQSIMVANRTEGSSPLSIAFSVHPFGGVPPYTYLWDFDDGTTSTASSPEHTFEGEEGEEGEFEVSLVVTDSEGNATNPSMMTVELREDEEGDLGFTLLDFVYGFAALTCILLVPVGFAAAYAHEVKKGTVRTLLCYPVGPLDITVAKLLFSFIVGFIFAFIAFSLPSGRVDKPFGDLMLVFVTAFVLTAVTMVIGALAALAQGRVMGRMWFRPYTLAVGAVVLAFVFTSGIMGLIGRVLSFVLGMDPDYLVETLAPLIAISPYHIGGEALCLALGGPGEFNPLLLAIPVLLLAGLGWLSMRVYPSVFEKE